MFQRSIQCKNKNFKLILTITPNPRANRKRILSKGADVDETVEGDVLYFANTVTIDGTVNGNLAVICDQLIINGTVNGNLDLLCDRVTVTETGLVTGDLKALAVKSVIVEGVVQGEITGEISRKQLLDTESGADPDLE